MSKIDPRIDAFVSHLEGLRDRGDRGALAALRRGLGRDPAAVSEAHRVVLPFTGGLREDQENLFYLTAGLFASHPAGGQAGSFGSALQRVRRLSPAGEGTLDHRFEALLDERSEALPYHLRQLVSLARAREVGIDWRQLLADLLAWSHPDRYVQRRWARDYFQGLPAPQGAGAGTTTTDQEEASS